MRLHVAISHRITNSLQIVLIALNSQLYNVNYIYYISIILLCNIYISNYHRYHRKDMSLIYILYRSTNGIMVHDDIIYIRVRIVLYAYYTQLFEHY